MGKELSSRSRTRLLFDIFLIIVALVFFFNSRELDFRAWLFPGSFSIILLVMAAVQTLMDWKQTRQTAGGREPASAGAEASREERKVAVDGRYARLGVAVLSLLGFYLIFRFATIYLAIPVLCVLLLRILGGRSWRTTGLMALGTDVFVYVFFQAFLQTSL